MPQSLSKLYVHLIFSTKHREPLLIPSVRDPLHAYLATVLKNQDCSSSKWLKTQARALLSFHWQNGYGGFSVGPAEVEAVAAYIEGQEEHHRVVSFQEEYRKFLQAYGVEYDERYVWD